MTRVMTALGTLANLDLPERDAALAGIHERWKDEALAPTFGGMSARILH